MAVYIYRLNAEQWQPRCTRCGWNGTSVIDIRRAVRAAREHHQACQAVPTKPAAEIDEQDGSLE